MHVYIYDHGNILLSSNILNRGNTKKKNLNFPGTYDIFFMLYCELLLISEHFNNSKYYG